MLKHYHLDETSPSVDRLSTFLSSSSTRHFESMQPDRFLELTASVATPKDRLLRIMRTIQQTHSKARRQSLATSQNFKIGDDLKSRDDVKVRDDAKTDSAPSDAPIDTSKSLFDSGNSGTAGRDHSGKRTSGVGVIKRSAISFLGHRRQSLQVTLDLGVDGGTTPASSCDWVPCDGFTGALLPTLADSTQDVLPSTTPTTTTPLTEWMTPGSALCDSSTDRSSVTSPDWFAPSEESAYILKLKHKSSSRTSKVNPLPKSSVPFPKTPLPTTSSDFPSDRLRRIRSTPTTSIERDSASAGHSKTGRLTIRRAGTFAAGSKASEPSCQENSQSCDFRKPTDSENVSGHRRRRSTERSPTRPKSKNSTRKNVLRLFQHNAG